MKIIKDKSKIIELLKSEKDFWMMVSAKSVGDIPVNIIQNLCDIDGIRLLDDVEKKRLEDWKLNKKEEEDDR